MKITCQEKICYKVYMYSSWKKLQDKRLSVGAKNILHRVCRVSK